MFENFASTTHAVNKELLVQLSQIPTINEMLQYEIQSLKDELSWVSPDHDAADTAMKMALSVTKIQSKIEAYEELITFLTTVQAEAAAKRMEN